MAFTIATITRTQTGRRDTSSSSEEEQEVKVHGLPATIVVAIIAFVPPFVSALIDAQTKPDTVKVEYAKMDVDKRK